MSQGPAARDDITETTLDPFDQQLRAIYGDHSPGGYLRHQERRPVGSSWRSTTGSARPRRSGLARTGPPPPSGSS